MGDATALSEKAKVEEAEQIDSRPESAPSHVTTDDVEEASDTDAVPRLPPPPDGGLHAWLKVFGGFLMYINIWGFTLTFGTFQAYYKHTLLKDSSASSISWIGTVQGFLLIMMGVLSGPLFDLGYFRPMLYAGNVLVVLGIMMLSLCKEYWQVFLSQGVCMGLGAGLLYLPSVALVGIWFERRRALAMGIVMSGIAVGGVVYIIIFDRLTPKVGFGWSVRTMGFIALFAALLSSPALLSGSSILARPRQARKLFDKSALSEPSFLIYSASTFVIFLGYIVPYFYIPTYARERLGLSESTALYMLVIAVAGSFFGRLMSGFTAHYLGPIFTWILCTAASGILALCWIRIESEKALIAFSLLWGFFSAALVTLPSAAFATLCPNLALLGTRLGMSSGVSSIATLIGAPIAGALLKRSESRTDFTGPAIWSGVCLLCGTACLSCLWLGVVRSRKKGWLV